VEEVVSINETHGIGVMVVGGGGSVCLDIRCAVSLIQCAGFSSKV